MTPTLVKSSETVGSVSVALASEADAVVAALTEAFRADPAVRWMLPDEEQFQVGFPAFARAFSEAAFDHGTVFRVTDGTGRCAGAAVWLPPDVAPDEEALVALVERLIPQKDQEDVFAVFEQMSCFHPTEPHWYLPLLGVAPAYQRRGCGAALLAPILQVCDRDRLPAYLESSNPANITLYERHGFEQIGIVRVGESEPMFPMVRAPR
jgi:ribosomal protein S18 acetylase RimI-like enzyme